MNTELITEVVPKNDITSQPGSTLVETDDSEEIEHDYDLTKLQNFVDSFKQQPIWKVMEGTVENSPWHREANVAVHTEMTLEYAKKFFPTDTTVIANRRHIVLVTLALLFHDTGKPPAEQVKVSEERGTYRSYAGHEQLSAREFESYMVDNWTSVNTLISKWDVFVITWMIEHHLPYGVKDPRKVLAVAKTLQALFLPDNGPEVFFNMLLGDTGGRISDAWETNFVNATQWTVDIGAEIAKLPPYDPKLYAFFDAPKHMIVLVGPPGVGKSTIRGQFSTEYVVFSLDELRVEFAKNFFGNDLTSVKENYRRAFHVCNENEKEFNKFTQDRLNTLFKYQDRVVIDNTNVSTKSRRQYLELARQNGFVSVAYYIPASRTILAQRNNTRDDKQLPPEALERLFNGISLPSLGGEFDEVYLLGHNFKQNEEEDGSE